MNRIWTAFFILAALAAAPVAAGEKPTASAKAGTDRCLTTLYNYPAEAPPALPALHPAVSLGAPTPDDRERPGKNVKTASAAPAK